MPRGRPQGPQGPQGMSLLALSVLGSMPRLFPRLRLTVLPLSFLLHWAAGKAPLPGVPHGDPDGPAQHTVHLLGTLPTPAARAQSGLSHTAWVVLGGTARGLVRAEERTTPAQQPQASWGPRALPQAPASPAPGNKGPRGSWPGTGGALQRPPPPVSACAELLGLREEGLGHWSPWGAVRGAQG